MSVKSVQLLPCGYCQIDRSALDTRLAPGAMTRIPIWAYLVSTVDGPVLVDTGMPQSCSQDPQGLFRGTDRADWLRPEMTADDLITTVLARCGLLPSDLLCIVSSHWHFDHAGGNTLFPDTEIVVQRAEFEAAMSQNTYLDVCRNPLLHYRLIDGDTDLFPGLRLLATPGHTPGHQSLLLHTDTSGPLLLTVDAAYCRENYEDGVPFMVANAALAAQSIDRLHDIAATTDAKVFFGHDATQASEWRPFPHIY